MLTQLCARPLGLSAHRTIVRLYEWNKDGAGMTARVHADRARPISAASFRRGRLGGMASAPSSDSPSPGSGGSGALLAGDWSDIDDAGLDHPVHASLTGAHAHLSRVAGRAGTYIDNVSTFCSVPADPNPGDWDDLARLLGTGGFADLFNCPELPPAQWNPVFTLDGLQMVAPSPGEPWTAPAENALPADAALVELGPQDLPEMIELVAETRPLLAANTGVRHLPRNPAARRVGRDGRRTTAPTGMDRDQRRLHRPAGARPRPRRTPGPSAQRPDRRPRRPSIPPRRPYQHAGDQRLHAPRLPAPPERDLPRIPNPLRRFVRRPSGPDGASCGARSPRTPRSAAPTVAVHGG